MPPDDMLEAVYLGVVRTRIVKYFENKLLTIDK